MTKYLIIAREYIHNTVGKDYDIVEDSIKDLKDFFCFTYQTKEFLKTGDLEDMEFGQGYLFICKVDERIFSYASSYSFDNAKGDLENRLKSEETIRKYFSGFNLKIKYDLVVNEILKKQILIDTLNSFEIKYVIPEIVGISIFRVPERYNKTKLEERLAEIPATFHGVDSDGLIYLVKDLLRTQCCRFDLVEHRELKYSKYVSSSSENDLKPIW